MPAPNPDRPRITLARLEHRVRVFHGQYELADSRQVIQLDELRYPPRLYFPAADIVDRLLERSDTTTHCPFKGDAHYYHVVVGNTQLIDACWCYAAPIDSMQQIAGHLAFDHAALRTQMFDN